MDRFQPPTEFRTVKLYTGNAIDEALDAIESGPCSEVDSLFAEEVERLMRVGYTEAQARHQAAEFVAAVFG